MLGLVPLLSAFHRELGAVRNWQYALLPLALWGLAAGGAFQGGERYGFRASGALRRALAAGVVLFCVELQLGRYAAYEINGVDFSIFDWMLFNSNHGRFGYSPIYDVNHFGVHANWVLLPLAALHRAWESHLLLVLVTAGTVAAGAWFAWRLAMELTGEDAVALLAAVAYVTSPQVGVLLDGGFRPEALFPPVGLWFAWGWTTRTPRRWLPAAFTFLCIKEDAALYLAGFAVGVLLVERARLRAAALLAGLGLLHLVLYVGWLQPKLLAPYGLRQPQYVTFWGQYGATLPEILLTMASSPLQLARGLLTSGALPFLGAALLLPVLSVRALAAMAPGLLLLGSASYGQMHAFRGYYPAALVPFMFWGALESWNVLARRQWSRRWRLAWTGAALLVLPLLGGGYARFRWPEPGRGEALARASARAADLGVPVCAQTVLFPHLPYALPLEPLFESCAGRPDRVFLVNPELDRYPHPAGWLNAFVAEAEASGRAESFGAGMVLVRPANGGGPLPASR